MPRTRTAALGPGSRPPAVPGDLETQPKASGKVGLPLHIRWSGPPIVYDLERPKDRARVYEQVLREGTEEDVQFYVEADQLIDMWDRLVLPPPVRRAFERHRSIHLGC